MHGGQWEVCGWSVSALWERLERDLSGEGQA